MHIFTKKTRLFLIIITIVMIISMALSTLPYKKANVIEDTFGIILSPFQAITDWAVKSTESFFSNFISTKDIQKRNKELKEEVNALNADLRELSNLKNENQNLKNLLELKNVDKKYDMVSAQVISRSWNNWESTLTINVGTNDGIKLNSTVVTDSGLVGYVYDVGTTWSKVMTIKDPLSSVSALVPRTGDDGIIQGDYNISKGQFCKMSFIDKESGISVGDLIETLGTGGIYPEGLYIGKVVEVNSVSDGVSKEAIIETGVDFTDLDFVLVIK
ncbi:MAG: rod shape-determining protein MreC [Ruminococcaceae bacterium]|nr:rod shape-determining protein MreC [Oscillospiraceae bacterium]